MVEASPTEIARKQEEIEQAQQAQIDGLRKSVNNLCDDPDGMKFLQWLCEATGWGASSVMVTPHPSGGHYPDLNGTLQLAAQVDIWVAVRRLLEPENRGKIENNIR